MVLVGGVKVNIPHKEGYLFQEGEVLSPDGHCKPFDASGKGTISSNGAGVVVLKRLEDAIADRDQIYAVIKGTALNNDGSNKVGYSAPSIDGQAEVIAEAQAISEIDPSTISYIEAHGTATELGDPIEIAALSKAFRSAGSKVNQFCAIGSVKSNIGHLDTAAGVTGLMKTALSLKNKKIVPSLNYNTPNPKIDFANSPFYVNTQLQDWQSTGTPRRAGVSSFGIGGTNAHAILEEAPEKEKAETASSESLLLLSAKSLESLNALSSKYFDFLSSTNESFLDIAYTSQVGRAQFYFRRAVAADSALSAANQLETQLKTNSVSFVNDANNKELVFLFPGQGAQYVNMAKQVYETETDFKNTLDYCFTKIKTTLGIDLKQVVFNESVSDEIIEQINQTNITQPLLFSIEYALAKLLMSWGITPKAMIGHSLGEYVAACISEVITLDDALQLLSVRGKLIQSLPKGDMLSILLPEEEIAPLLNENISIAAVNAPGFSVVSGNPENITKLEKELTEKNISFQKLHTSHAFHSAMMNPILDAFYEEVKKITLSKPTIPFISNLTGNWADANEVTDPYYWVKHLRNTVKFADGAQILLESENTVFLEVGPGRILSTLAKQNAGSNQPILIN
ncbi:MAG: type I polyketide synthase [Chloroflexia bacterium]|nr:type I polyketide synthase [Chloroflexia bacterium]